jgi:hypothetical protein
MDTLLSPKDSLLSPAWEENESRFGSQLDSTFLNLKSLMLRAKFYILLLDLGENYYIS